MIKQPSSIAFCTSLLLASVNINRSNDNSVSLGAGLRTSREGGCKDTGICETSQDARAENARLSGDPWRHPHSAPLDAPPAGDMCQPYPVQWGSAPCPLDAPKTAKA